MTISRFCLSVTLECTPLKLNIAPTNRHSQKETHLPTIMFQGRAVKFRACTFLPPFIVLKSVFSWKTTIGNFTSGPARIQKHQPCGLFPATSSWPLCLNEENDSLNLLLMVQESGEKTTGWMWKTNVNNGKHYRAQLVSRISSISMMVSLN